LTIEILMYDANTYGCTMYVMLTTFAYLCC